MTARRFLRGIGARLLLAQTLVLLAAVLTAGLVAGALGPRLFRGHLMNAGPREGGAMRPFEQAYASSSRIALIVGLVTALVLAALVSWYVTRRIARPLEDLGSAARSVAAGDYRTRVADTGHGAEIDSLGRAFNDMARQMETTEQTRRRLLTDIAHELRTPVAAIAARLEGLEDGVTKWDARSAEAFRSQVDRLTRLATDLSEVSRAEEQRFDLRLAELDVREVLQAAARSVQARFDAKGVTLQLLEPPDGPCRVNADSQRIAQLVDNLLSNALRHTPAGGQVTVSLSCTLSTVVVDVRDTGEGIPPEQLPHVFERFYRGDSARHADGRGSGVGLTISRGIAEAHGGTLTIMSDGRDRGTTVTLELPASQGSSAVTPG